MEIKENFDLKNYNTFGISEKARFFVEIENDSDLIELFSSKIFQENQKIFLGGGSNVLFTKDFDGIVILNKLKGIEIIKEDGENVWLKIGSGENWHDLVSFVCEKNWWGIENLAFIPGTVGASPMQNIGAYGAEIKDTLESVEAYQINSSIKKIFNKSECELGYRESVFKNKYKDQYFIASIFLKLSKIPKINLEYRAIQEYLKNNPKEIKTSQDVMQVITEIRKSKLPDPKILGSAGSFFKNIFLTKEQAEKFLQKFPNTPIFDEDDYKKIPAGWLIEECGWKGFRQGNVGVHELQALVLVNHGGAKGEEVLSLVQKIVTSVKEKFDLQLVPEVNII